MAERITIENPILGIRATAREFFYAPYVPIAIQRALAAPLAALGRRRGYRSKFPEYTTPEALPARAASSPST
jgi:hypothetical protein